MNNISAPMKWPDRAWGATSGLSPLADTGTWAAARDACTDLLREQGELLDPNTDLETAEEVASLAALLVAYSCVPPDH
jgi:hypothetical protein